MQARIKELLRKLRLVYCHKILTWNGNKNRPMIMKNVAAYTKGKRTASVFQKV